MLLSASASPPERRAGGDPSTENENLGNYNTRATVGFDRAFITYKPLSWLYFTGGRLGNPFFSPTTMVWGDDLALQGVIAGLKLQIVYRADVRDSGRISHPGPRSESIHSSRSKWLYGPG